MTSLRARRVDLGGIKVVYFQHGLPQDITDAPVRNLQEVPSGMPEEEEKVRLSLLHKQHECS